MKDLSNYKNPFDFEMRETCGVNASFIGHIPYKRTFEEVSNDKFYEDAILEMIARCGNDHVLAQFSDEGVPGASKQILNAIKNSVNIIAAILSVNDISNFYPVEDTAYENLGKFVDKIHIHPEINDDCSEMTIFVGYQCIYPDNPEMFIQPITVQCIVPLTYKHDKLRHKDDSVPGDNVYILHVGVGVRRDPNEEHNELTDDVDKLNDNIALRFDETIKLLYKLINNEKNSRCSTCRGNKSGCLVGNLPTDIILANLYNNYDFGNLDNNKLYDLTLRENDVGGFKKFFNVDGRRMVEFTLMVEDYINTPEEKTE